ncbi:serine/arginine repetitive matrix protein 1-like [Delphinapterus leucas]|uniref:Serine/arginine repetitive matrix protein 1-like n=1 Tax=Delphinapterus leucas TaxID=9749 RepID=A0A2Y9LMP0_DELLE|nr:serine/arginine repetitive matrix protein 1-like [Delphinapterus leucas]
MHKRAHRRSPGDTLEGKVKLKAREPGSRREPPQPPRAMTDAAEAAFSPPMPPSRCSRRAPCPRLPRPLPRRSRVRAPPPPGAPGARRARGARRLEREREREPERERDWEREREGRWGPRRAARRPPRATPEPLARPLGWSPPGARDPASGGRRGVSLSGGPFWRPLTLGVGPRIDGGSGLRGVQPPGRS